MIPVPYTSELLISVMAAAVWGSVVSLSDFMIRQHYFACSPSVKLKLSDLRVL